MGELAHNDPSAGFQHPIHLTQGNLGVVDIAQTKTDGDRVKTAHGKGQRLRVAFDKFNVWVSFSTLGDHSRRKVECHHGGTGFLEGFARSSRPGCYVQNPITGLNVERSDGRDAPQRRIAPR